MGIMTIFVIIITITLITIIGFGAQGRSEFSVELYHILSSKPLATGAQPAIVMEVGAADRNHGGEGQGGTHTHTTGNHRGVGGDTMGWGGGGES